MIILGTLTCVYRAAHSISNVELKIVVVNEPATTCDPDGKVKVGSPQSVSGHSMLSPCNITSGLTSQFITV